MAKSSLCHLTGEKSGKAALKWCRVFSVFRSMARTGDELPSCPTASSHNASFCRLARAGGIHVIHTGGSLQSEGIPTNQLRQVNEPKHVYIVRTGLVEQSSYSSMLSLPNACNFECKNTKCKV